MMLPARCCSLRRNFASFLLCLTVSYGLIALVGVVFPGSLPRSLAQSTDSANGVADRTRSLGGVEMGRPGAEGGFRSDG